MQAVRLARYHTGRSQAVVRTIRRHALLARGGRALVALSGGPDSVALAHLLLDQTAAPQIPGAHHHIGERDLLDGSKLPLQHDYVANAVGDYSILSQLRRQASAVIVTLAWSATVAFVAYKIVDRAFGLRVSQEMEHEGLDTPQHGERAYS